MIHAIDRLGSRYKPSDPQFEAQAIKLLQHGNPWLERPSHYWLDEDANRTIESVRYIAMAKDDDSDANLTFRDILTRQSEVPPQFVDSTPDRTYVTTETAGLPLMAIPNLDRYRDEGYRGLIREEAIHADANLDKFRDILPMHPDEAKTYKKVLRLVAYALLLGTLRVRTDKRNGGARQMIASMVDPQDISGRDEDLGPLSVAIRQLTNRSGQRWINQINRDIQSRRNAWGLTETARFVALLHVNGRNAAFIPEELAEAMHALAHQEIQRNPQMHREAKEQLDTLTRWATERPPRSGLFIMTHDIEATL